MTTPEQNTEQNPGQKSEQKPEQKLEQKLKTARKSFRAKLVFGTLGGVLLFALVVPLAYFSHSVSFRVAPQLAANDAEVSVSAGAGLVLFNTAYLLGERATLRVESHGFISRAVAVDFQKGAKSLLIEMREAPLNGVITTEPSLAETRWHVNGVYSFTAARFEQEFQSGAVTIEVNNKFYHPEILQIDVQTGKDFAHHLNLRPVIGRLNINSDPPGALVRVDDTKKGVTPLQIADVPGGLLRLQVILDGYEKIEEEISITNSLTEIERDYRLTVKRAAVRINASPGGGILRVNGVVNDEFSRGLSRLPLAVGKKHTLRYQKPGYIPQSGEVLLKPDEQVEISFQLEKEIGEVVIRSTPPAEVAVDGRPAGTTPQTLHLQALRQKITLRRPQYRTMELFVTPTAAAPLLIDEKLQTEFAARLSEVTPFLTVAGGVKMKFFDPHAQAKNRFTMGAPVSDKIRRANEFQREVNLTKPFYVSTTEITEQQFSQYKQGPVTGKNHPVRNVSWPDAAGFANWMSARDGLQPAYRFADGQLRSFDATADGYRLPSEAEWEWLARVAGRPEIARFVWGDSTTIPANSGNFADESAKGSVPKYIPRYRDGFAGVAPVASFTPDAAGLYDMAGNVSEWVHDVYDLHPPPPGRVETNPFGGQQGDGRVVKGASFRSATLTGLRSSFRDGLLRGRDDVGFRLVRYVYGKEQ